MSTQASSANARPELTPASTPTLTGELPVTRPTTVLIGALGGEGGGVLSNWLVEAAQAAGLSVQATSVP
ncbi:MAG: hypothetical protein ACI9W2_005284, partial [Gammaproteobacteria bacterium]